jgi:hypothetical protein
MLETAFLAVIGAFSLGFILGTANGRRQVNREVVLAALMTELTRSREIPFPTLDRGEE